MGPDCHVIGRSHPSPPQFLIIFLPLVSIIRYSTYISTGFENDVKEAEVFVDGDRKTHYIDFLDTLLSSKTDDIVLLMALLYANVDKYTTHKILLTFANLTTWKNYETDDMNKSDVRMAIGKTLAKKEQMQESSDMHIA